ncbi:MAG: hypothetical protein M1819_007161 [Sarea resinae]|nr:MAG: hypothetical protein M1819_007161 [Sarea resinae]
MRAISVLYPAILALCAITSVTDAAAAKERKPANAVLLSDVKTLTLRKDAKTTARRVSAIPQVNNPSTPTTPASVASARRSNANLPISHHNFLKRRFLAQPYYTIDVMRCKNQGTSYSDDTVEWTCTASLPPEFKLGSTDVICEGYASPNDPYILKGSCGVEYRLLLTEEGEKRYGSGTDGDDLWRGFKGSGTDWVKVAFWVLFVGVVAWMLYAAFIRDGAARGLPPPPRRGNGWGGFGGGGGGGDDNDDPPPPYDPRPPGGPPRKSRSSSSRAAPAAAGGQGWRPGLWSGMLGGAAAGYMAGRRGQNGTQTPGQGRNTGWGGGGGLWGDDAGEGSSRGSSSRSSPSASFSSTRYESSGFGSTSRR